MKKSLFLTVAMFFFLISNVIFAEVIKNIDYAGDGKLAHTLNIYTPDGTGPFPVVLHYTGLAFSWSDAKGDGGLAGTYNTAGFAVVGPNLSGGGTGQNQARYPTQIQELKAAVRFLRANADKYKLDPKFIGVIGFSSGAWNSVMLATTGDVDEYKVGSTSMNLEGTLGGNLEFSSRVQASWAAAAPTDFLIMDSCGSDMNHGGASSPEGSIIGGALAQNKEKCALANPITYITSDDPPIHLVHGTADRIVPTCQSVVLYNALSKSANKHEMTYTPASGGHAANYTGSLDFFKKALAANKEGCLDPGSQKFDSLATYCSTGKCCDQTAVKPVTTPDNTVLYIGNSRRIDKGAETISILSPGRHNLQIFNSLGAKVISESGRGNAIYSLMKIRPGIYFVKLSVDGITTFDKIARY